jgi:hypothetical protein
MDVKQQRTEFDSPVDYRLDRRGFDGFDQGMQILLNIFRDLFSTVAVEPLNQSVRHVPRSNTDPS